MNTIKAMKQQNSNRMSLAHAARQMGIEKEALGKHAENYWEMLNDLAESDPKAYQDYLSKQMEDAKKQQDQLNKKTIEPKYYISLIINGKHKRDNIHKRIVVNLCSHQSVENPLDNSGARVKPNENGSLSGLTIPLAIGKPRELVLKDKKLILAVEVLVSEWVIHKVEQHAEFQQQVFNLVTYHVEGELNCSLHDVKPIQYDKDNVKNEFSEMLEISQPIPFEISPETTEEETQQEGKINKKSSELPLEQIVSSPQNLLDLLKAENNHQNMDTRTEVPTLLQENKSSGKKLITELTNDSTNESTSNTIKKGFLSKSKTSIYPDSGSAESIPSTIWDRAKVIDTAKSNQNESNPPQQKVAKESTYSSQADPFLNMAENLDDELRCSNVQESVSDPIFGSIEQANLFVEQLKIFGNAFEPMANNANASTQKRDSKKSKSQKNEGHKNLPKAFYELKDVDVKHVKIIFHIPNVKSMSLVDLQISDEYVTMKVDGIFSKCKVSLPVNVHASTAKAKFKKSQGKLIVTAKKQS